MARIRSIKPEYWGDYETAASLSRDARLLYIAMWNFCDEWARMHGDPRYVKGHCFPYEDDLDPDAVDALIDQLARVGNVVRYTTGGAPYLWLPNLAKHQRLEPHKVPSRLPEPPDHDPSGPRAEKSARRSDETERNVAQQVAGGREQGAGSSPQNTLPHASSGLPDTVTSLRSRLEAKNLTVRWDKLTPEQVSEVSELVETHGVPRLVKVAGAAFQPDNPVLYAQGWLPHWRQLSPPDLRLVEDLCKVHEFQREPAIGCRYCASEAKAADR